MSKTIWNDLPFSIVDAHHHLWDLDAVSYPWLMAKGVKRFFGDPAPIQKNYLVENFKTDFGNVPIEKSVHIQVGSADTLAETTWLQNCSENEKFPHAMVAYCDLESSNRDLQLDGLQAFNALRGIRQIIGRHPEEDAQHGTDSLLSDPNWSAGLIELAKRDLSFDLQLIPDQLEPAFEVFSQVENLKVAICHAGSPWYRDPEGWAMWKNGLRKFSELPNVVCKISGLGMFDRKWTVASLRPVFDTVIEIFGVERCMFGSNFPVDKLYGGYEDLWLAYLELCNELSNDEKALLFNQNATQFYRLD